MQQQKAPAPGTAAVGATYILDRGPLRVRATTPCVLLVDTTLDPSAPV